MRTNKKAQVTIFIIVAIVIIAAVILFFLVSDTGKNLVNKIIPGPQVNPEQQIQDCFANNDNIDKKIAEITGQGGVSNPQNYDVYNGTKVEYLCYTTDYLKTCYIQRPILLRNLESEIKNSIKSDVESCISKVEQSLREQGYEVKTSGKVSDISLAIVPGKININSSYQVNIVGKQNTYSIDKLELSKNSKTYDLVMICASILNYESVYGNSETLIYMTLYPNVKVEKIQKEEGSRVYILTQRESGEKFAFAVRSLVWPAGYSQLN